jgi:hypothetical protein
VGDPYWVPADQPIVEYVDASLVSSEAAYAAGKAMSSLTGNPAAGLGTGTALKQMKVSKQAYFKAKIQLQDVRVESLKIYPRVKTYYRPESVYRTESRLIQGPVKASKTPYRYE